MPRCSVPGQDQRGVLGKRALQRIQPHQERGQFWLFLHLLQILRRTGFTFGTNFFGPSTRSNAVGFGAGFGANSAGFGLPLASSLRAKTSRVAFMAQAPTDGRGSIKRLTPPHSTTAVQRRADVVEHARLGISNAVPLERSSNGKALMAPVAVRKAVSTGSPAPSSSLQFRRIPVGLRPRRRPSRAAKPARQFANHRPW